MISTTVVNLLDLLRSLEEILVDDPVWPGLSEDTVVVNEDQLLHGPSPVAPLAGRVCLFLLPRDSPRHHGGTPGQDELLE